MTAFGGAISDPTAIIGGRIGAYIVDIIIATVLIFGLMWALDSDLIHSHDEGSSLSAQQTSADMTTSQYNRNRNEIGSQNPDNSICIARGSTVYIVNDGDVGELYGHMVLYGLLITLINQMVLPATTGASLGKHLFGLRVVTANGRKAGFFRNMVRYFALIIDAFCCYCIPGLLVARRSRGHRRIGDMLAGTFVIHNSAENRLLHIPGLQIVHGRSDGAVWNAPSALGQPRMGEGGGIDAPVWDEARKTYVRYDQVSGWWHQWDEATQQWLPVQT